MKTNNDIFNKIINLKSILKDKIIIPVHHYQVPEVVKFGDLAGDSYKLALDCSMSSADFIVFCGVLFMAEVASIMAKDNQKILIPEKTAGCPMADMAEITFVKKAYEHISKECSREIAPVIYINSYADLKSFCGEHDGSVCTSSNAYKIIDYFFKQNKAIMFFPDYFLGKNTANFMGIDEKHIVKIKKDISVDTKSDIKIAKMFLWDGYCPIHQKFTSGDIKYLREKYPEIKIIVHPESVEEVVNLADLSGSTQKIFKLIDESPSGSIWGVGTETTFVNRLNEMYLDKTILPLRESKCRNMNKITPELLAESLQSIYDFLENNGSLKYEVQVNNQYKENAKKSLEKMINIVEG